jgi:hypothetical protein
MLHVPWSSSSNSGTSEEGLGRLRSARLRCGGFNTAAPPHLAGLLPLDDLLDCLVVGRSALGRSPIAAQLPVHGDDVQLFPRAPRDSLDVYPPPISSAAKDPSLVAIRRSTLHGRQSSDLKQGD